MAGGADRAEADRARAILLTLGGWTSVRIAEAFGVREDTVRLWRSDFMSGGVGALKASVAPGPTPVKAAAALKVASPLLSAPVADRTNWTLARRRSQAARGSQSPDRSSPRCCAKKGFRWRRPRHTLKGRQGSRNHEARDADQAGRHCA
jgi:transposase